LNRGNNLSFGGIQTSEADGFFQVPDNLESDIFQLKDFLARINPLDHSVVFQKNIYIHEFTDPAIHQ
jgi:hypothetical protein